MQSLFSPPRVLASIALTAAPFAVLFACTDAPEAGRGPDEDAGAVLPPTEGGPEGAVDGGADADANAPARVCSADGFCHAPLPPDQHLRGVWGDGTGVVWAVSLERNVLRWDGTSWKIHSRTLGDITGIWGSGPTDIWISTSEELLRSRGADPTSLTFAPIVDLPGDGLIPIRAVWGTRADDVWAVGALEPDGETPKGRVLHYGGDTAGGGTGWTLDEGLSAQRMAFRSVWGTETSGAWLYGVLRDADFNAHVLVFRRRPGTSMWMPMALPEDPHDEYYPFASTVLATHIASDTSVFILGATALPTDVLWRGTSSDEGATFAWTFDPPNPNPNDRDLLGIWGTPSKLWAIGKTGFVARWTGQGWKQALLSVDGNPVGRSLWAIWGKNDDDFWVVGDEIALHKTNAGRP